MPGLVRSFCLIAFLFAAIPGGLASPSNTSPADDPEKDETELRAVIEKFFELYANEDLEGLMRMWSEKSPDYAARKKAMAELFAKEDYRASNLTITRVKVDGDKASLRASVQITTLNTQTKRERQEKMIRDMRLAREADGWKVWRDALAVNDLAKALVEAADEEARQALLTMESELMTHELVAAVRASGSEYYNQARYEQAMPRFRIAQALAEKINDRKGIAASLHSIGAIHYRQGNYAQALDFNHRALKLREEDGDKAGAASSLNFIGSIHYRLGNYTQALDFYNRSLKLREEVGDKLGVALSLDNIGFIYGWQGKYAQALELHHRSLKVIEEVGGKEDVALCLTNIGNIYYRQGSYAQALDFYRRSLKLLEEVGYKAGIAGTLNNIGAIHRYQDDFTQALDYYHRSLKLNEELGNKAGMTLALNNIGNIHQNQDAYTRAMDFYHRGMKLLEEVGNKAGIADTLINIGNLHYRQGKYAQALEQAQKAAAIARSIGDAETVFTACLNEGRAHQALKNLTEARRSFTEAIAVAETLRRASAGGEVGQQLLFERKTTPYLAMSDLLVSQNETAEALSFVERAKARTMLDTLQSGRVNIAKAMTAQEREQEDNLRAQLVSLNAQVFREQQRDKRDQGRLKELESRRAQTQLAFDDFQTRLYASHPELKVQRGEVKPLSLPEAGALLPDDKTALLEYAVAGDKTLLFILTKAAYAASITPDLKVYSIPIKAKDLAGRTEKFRRMLAGKDIGFKKEAKAFYELLLKPAQSTLRGKSSLIIAPDGPLWELPFQALVSDAGRYLIEEAAISYAPSLTYLREMSRKRVVEQTGARRTLLAIGNPALARQVGARAQFATRGDEKLEPLPLAEKEALALAVLYGAEQTKVYTEAEAMESRFKEEAGGYRILHLATHGILNNSSPMYSQVLLSQADTSEKEDGLLEAWEIMNLDLKTDLVVLSACETARGRVGAGEGVIGLTWAFFVAGAPAIVVSQWKVIDTSTQHLMVEFHRQLKTKPSQGKAKSLRQAMLKVMKRPKTVHPYHWAPFVLVGAGW
jgi:CHAT domain-containing protein/ketosteroid isomerase-like protein